MMPHHLSSVTMLTWSPCLYVTARERGTSSGLGQSVRYHVTHHQCNSYLPPLVGHHVII